jgi:hypothetical protein
MMEMQLDNCRIIFAAVGLIGILLFSCPGIGLFIKIPSGENFSEIYFLGSDHNFDNIPFNIKAGVTYTVYLGVGNQIGSSGYYQPVVKFCNANESLLNSTLGTPSPLPALFQYNTFIGNKAKWETPLTFQFKTLIFDNNVSYVPYITINGFDYSVNEMSTWSSNKTGYYYNLFVELWIFNSTLAVSQFDNRNVNLFLNMTV